MANISVTYSFSNGTTADATEVNTNFQDVIDGTSDGTKDFSISALTVAGTATLNGNCNLGNATSDDITITGRIAADVDPKTASATDLGDSTQLWRAVYADNILATANAVGDPAYSFHADTNTGIYQSAADHLDFATGGVRGGFFDDSQRLTLPANPAFRAYKNSASQTLTDATTTKITFDAEEYDQSTAFASSTFTPVALGVYALSAMVRISGTSMARYILHIYKNGSSIGKVENRDLGAVSTAQNINISMHSEVTAATDYFEVYAFADVGSGSVTVANGAADTWFCGAKIA